MTFTFASEAKNQFFEICFTFVFHTCGPTPGTALSVRKIFSPIGILLIVPLNRSTFNEVFNIVLLKIRNQNKRSNRDIFTFHPSLLCERANLLSVYIVEVEVSESS